MIDQNICRKCYESSGVNWTAYQEYHYRVSNEVCCVLNSSTSVCSYGDAPDNCKFKLEQTVINHERDKRPRKGIKEKIEKLEKSCEDIAKKHGYVDTASLLSRMYDNCMSYEKFMTIWNDFKEIVKEQFVDDLWEFHDLYYGELKYMMDEELLQVVSSASDEWDGEKDADKLKKEKENEE